MAKRPTKAAARLRLPHVRAVDYRMHHADSILHRVEDETVVLTFSVNDRVIVAEDMPLLSEEKVGAVYGPGHVEEKHQRTDVVSVRVALSELLGTLTAIQKRIEDSSNEQ